MADKGVRFKEKLVDPATASREQLLKQVKAITAYFIRLAEDFEKRIYTIYDHEKMVERVLEISQAQREAWDSGETENFDKDNKELKRLLKNIDKQILSILRGVEVQMSETEVAIRLVRADVKSLRTLYNLSLDDYNMETKEYKGLLPVATTKLEGAKAVTDEEIHTEAKLIAVHAKLNELLTLLGPILQLLQHEIQKESNVLTLFDPDKKAGFNSEERNEHERLLDRIVKTIHGYLIQEKVHVFDQFNSLARSEISVFDRLSVIMRGAREKNVKITQEDIERLEKTVTNPFELGELVCALKSDFHSDLVTKGARKYAAKLYVQAQKGLKDIQLKATHDLMMGIKNRISFEEDLKKIIKEKISFCLVLIDIDHFKKFNDTYGHEIGDKVLIEVADILKRGLKRKKGQRTDEVYRIGGEEITLLLKKTDLKGGVAVAERMRLAVKEHNMVNYRGEKISQLTISSGVIMVTDYRYIGTFRLGDPDIAKKVVKQADILLYKAKHAGRDNVQSAFFDPNMDEKAAEAELKGAE